MQDICLSVARASLHKIGTSSMICQAVSLTHSDHFPASWGFPVLFVCLRRFCERHPNSHLRGRGFTASTRIDTLIKRKASELQELLSGGIVVNT